jgi:hypothetical protein
MAEEDFLIKLGLDPSGMTDGVRRAVNESLAEINRLQKAAGDENPDARVAQLPNAARESLYSVDKSSTSELNKQKNLQQKMVEQRAKLIALAQQEATVVARAAGKTASSDQLGKIRAGGESALATSLGLDKLTPAIKGQITRLISDVNTQFAPLQNLTGAGLQNQFRTIANNILPSVGIQEKASVRQTRNVVANQAGAYDPSADDARIARASAIEANASERSAETAREDAADAERSAASKRSSRRREELADKKAADAAEERAASLRFKRTKFDTVVADAPGASANPELSRYEISRSFDQRSKPDGYLLTYPGQSGPDDYFKTQREAKEAAAEFERRRLSSLAEEVAQENKSATQIKSANNEQVQAVERIADLQQKRVVALTKAQAAELKYFLDVEKESGLTPSGQITGTPSRPKFEYSTDRIDAVRSFASNIEDIGQDKLSSGVRDDINSGRVEVNAANKILADLSQAEISLAEQGIKQSTQQLAIDSQTTLQKQEELDAAQKASTASTEVARRQQTVAQLMRSLESQVRRGVITAEEGNAQLFQRGAIAPGERTTLNTIEDQRRIDNTPEREPSFDAEEQALIRALINKKEALDRQTLVLTSNYAAFKSAEELLIDALKRKAAALNTQTSAIQTPIPVKPESRTRQTKDIDWIEPEQAKPKPRPKETIPDIDTEAQAKASRDARRNQVGRQADQIRFADWDFSKQELKYLEAEQRKINAANEQAAIMDAATTAQRQASVLSAQQTREQSQVIASYKGLDLSIQQMIAANAAFFKSAQAATDERRRVANLPLSERFPRTNQSGTAFGAIAGEQPISRRVRPVTSPVGFASDFDIYNQALNQALIKGLPKSGTLGFGEFDGFNIKDSEVVDKSAEVLAKAMFDSAVEMTIAFGGLSDEIVEARATAEALKQRMAGAIKSFIVGDDFLFSQYTQGAAENKVARKELDAGRESVIMGDTAEGEALRRRLIAAQRELEGYTREQANQYARDLANDPARLKAEAELILNRTKLSTALIRETMATEGATQTLLSQKMARMERDLSVREAMTSTPEGVALLQATEQQRRYERDIRANPAGEGRRTFVGNIRDKLGYSQGGETLTEFFGGGALASLRYGLPSMLMYGVGSGIMNTIKEAEELQYNLSRLEGQFESTFGGAGDFNAVRSNILGVAKDTGLAADEIANLQIQLTGAFGRNIEIDGLTGEKLIEDQVESAAKLAQTIGLPLKEITDGLTAASLAFEASFERIGDVSLALEQESGVLARETVSFIGDIAPVAQEAGYSLEEFAAIAAVAQQRSGRSGAALAESFGRVIPALTEQKDKLMEIAALEPSLQNDAFVDAIRLSDPKAILDQIGRSYETMSKEGQQATISLLGGRREAQAIIPAITNQRLIERFTKDAEEAEGTLEDRFAKIQETLTNAIQRVQESLRQLGVAVLELGLADAFENAIDLAKLFLGVLTPLLEAINGVNRAFGGFPLSVLAGLAALKAFNRFVLQRPAFKTNQFGLQVPVRDEFGRQQREYRLSASDMIPQQQARYVQQYRDLRYTSTDPFTGQRSPGRIQGAFINQNLSRTRAFGQVARGAGTDLLAGIGNGSVALGAGFIGITALISLYGWANQQISKEKENVAALREEIEKANQAVDLTVPEIKSRRIDDLRALARDANESRGFWRALGGELSDAETYLAEALALETTEGYDDAIKVMDSSRSLTSDIFDRYGVKLGKNTGGLRDNVAAYKETLEATNGSIQKDAEGALAILNSEGEKMANAPITGRDAQYIQELSGLLEVKPEDLDAGFFGFAEATLQKDSTTEILNLAKNDPEAVKKYGVEAIDYAQQYVEVVFGLGAKDKDFEKEINALLSDMQQLPPLEENQLQLEQLKAGFDTGVIGITEYASRVIENLKARRRILQIGDQTASSELQILQVLQREQQAYAEFAQALISRQEQDLEISSIINGENAIAQARQEIENNTSNLANPAFQDRESRRQAAINIITAEKTLAIEQAKRTGDINEVVKILNDGIKISAPASSALMIQDLNNNEDFVKIKEQIKGQFNELFAIEDIDKFYERIFTDVLDDGQLSQNNQQGLNSMLTETLGKMNAASFESLGQGEKDAVLQSFDQIVVLMDFAGIGREKILEALRRKKGNQNLTPAELNAELDRILLEGLLPDPKETANFDNKQALDAISFTFRDDIRNARSNTIARAQAEFNEATARLNELKSREARGLYVDAEDMAAAEDAQVQADIELRNAYATAESAKIDYFATINRINGNLIGAMNQELVAIRVQIEAAKANFDDIQTLALQGQEAQKLDEIRKQQIAEANSLSQLNAGVATLNGDTVGAALYAIQEAQNNLNGARTIEEINSAKLALAQAQDSLRRAQSDTRNRDFDVWAALMEFEGNTVAAAITRVKQAEYQLSIAKPGDETAQAQMALMQAQTALRQAQSQEREAAYRLFGAEIAGQDPVAQAKVDLALAKEQLKYAKGTIEQANARVAVIEAQRALNEAMNDARYSVYNLRQAELQAMGDDVGAAQVAAELARQQLNDAIKAGAGVSAVNNARASFISADKAAKDAVFQDRMDEYKWLLDMGRISKSQYINYLEGLKSTLIPGTKQFKDLELSIKQLKDDVGGDLQANLPTSLRLPTLYEVRRFDQTPQMGGSGYGVGYQDNRQVSISVEINDASQDTAGIVVKTLEDALGTGRNGYGQRRF